MCGLWVEQQSIKEEGQGVCIVTHASMSKTHVCQSTHIVWPQVQSLLVNFECTHCVHVVCHSRSILVPKSMIHWVLTDTILKEYCCLCEVPLYKREDTKSQGNISIFRLKSVSLNKGLSYDIKLDISLRDCGDQMIKVRVILKPVAQMSYGFSLL
jgi:hypothetical protein